MCGGRGTLVHKIADHLANVKRPALLDEVAQQLDIDLGGWDPKLDRAGKVAMLLLQAPTEKLAAALEPLLGVLPGSSIREIVNMLRGCWIDRELAGRFAVLALGPTGRRIAAVNACLTPFTPSAILMRASARYPPWRHFPVSATAGEDIVGAIVAQVRADLAAAHPDWADAEVAEEMSDLGKTQPGVIVIAPPVDSEPLIGDDEIAELVGRFPAWTVLVLTGTKQLVAVGQSIRSLAPALATGEEAAARKQFRAIEARIAQVGASR